VTSAVDPFALATTERQLQTVVVAYAHTMGWKLYHTYDSRRSEPGFPDLAMLRGPRQVVAELKRQRLDPTREQWEWLDAFALAGAETYVWRPSDWRDGTIERILA
jgi:hypothetical protein